jgi:threonine/homoserine/homoserine lactone efflux protein
METVLVVLPLAVLLACISPGPSFIVVARASVADSSTAGVQSAVGMGLGSVLFATVTLLGFARLLDAATWLHVVLRVVGAGYLSWLAVQVWRSAREPLAFVADDDQSTRQRRWLAAALVAQLSNPKTAMFYVSVFASLLPSHVPLSTIFVLIPVVFTIEVGWYSVVALVLSRRRPQQAYRRAKTSIDRVVATVLGAFGLRLLVTSSPGGA